MAKRKPRKNVDPEAVIELTNQMRTFGNELVPVEAVYHVKGLAPRTRGPWNKEAEKIAFRDSATGYSCIIRRSPQTGALEGFVAISPNHPLFNFSNGAVESVGVTAYGGVNYARACEDGAPEWFSVCHVVHHDTSTIAGGKSGDSAHPDPLWWIGFSCDQPGDILPNHPGTVAMSSTRDGIDHRVYRDEAFAYHEVTRLAAQLKAVEDGRDPSDLRSLDDLLHSAPIREERR